MRKNNSIIKKYMMILYYQISNIIYKKFDEIAQYDIFI